MDYNEKLLQIISLPDCATIQQNIEEFLKNMVSQKKADGVVFGLSGGIDSVTVAYLAAKVFGKKAPPTSITAVIISLPIIVHNS